jgi:thioredoxin reductase (NADPH)
MMKKILVIVLVAMSGVGAFFILKGNNTIKTEKSLSIDMIKASTVKNTMPVVIIGSGVAGLSAATYASRAGLPVVVISGNKPGGALTETTFVENWPGREKALGTDIMNDLQGWAKGFGARFLSDTVTKIEADQWPFKVHTENGSVINALTIIVATGSTPQKLDIEGEEKFWGKGVTTCAKCDGHFYKGGNVVVVGGGDSAVEEAIQLSSHAKKITILVRKDHMRAIATMKERLNEYPNISISYNKEIKKINGNDKVTSIDVFDSKTKKIESMAIDAVFLAIGHTPNSSLFEGILEMDEKGYIAVQGKTQQTSISGIFAAGEVEDSHYKQAGTAAGDGIKAGINATEFLTEHGYTAKIAQIMAPHLLKEAVVVAKEKAQDVKHISTKHELNAILEHASEQGRPVIVDFYAEYCPSCMRMLPNVKSVASELSDKVEFYTVDIGESNEIAESYKITSVPALLVFNGGKVVDHQRKAMGKKELHDFAIGFIDQIALNEVVV